MNILLVYNGYAHLEDGSLQKFFDEICQTKHGDDLSFDLLELAEDEWIHGNLMGFLEAHKKVLSLYPHPKPLPDTIVYIHDAGMSKRIFPLQFLSGKPSKGLVRLPTGPAIAQTFHCLVHNLPFLKGTVVIVPIDHFYSYCDLNLALLRERIERFGMVMLQIDVPVLSAVGRLGVSQLDPSGRIVSFLEKPTEEGTVPLARKGTVLANTFQIFLSQQGMQGLLDAFDEFQREEKELSRDLDIKGWDFSSLVSETLTRPDEKLNVFQRAFKERLKKYEINLGGLEVRGEWRDWSSSITVYIEFIKANVSQAGAPDLNGNYWIRTAGIKIIDGDVKDCIFIDCDTVDLHGHFSGCIFVNCKRCRVAVATHAQESVFANLFEVNSLSVETTSQLYAWGKTGRRKIFSITGFTEDYRELYDGPGSFVKGWWNGDKVAMAGRSSGCEEKRRRVLLRTFGCQMNTYDSQVAAGILEKEGFEVIEEPESDGDPKGSLARGADVVIMNTCSVRDHAEQRVWGRLGMLGAEKKEKPELILGLMGCMVEEHRDKLFKRFPYLDLMVGTRHIKELPEMIRQVQATREHVARIKQDGISIEYSEYTKRDSAFHAWLPIMTGCNKECTFCIVPMTRGSEVSMPAGEVVREAKRLVADGVKWITLLGQNVNSYNGTRSTGHEKDGNAIDEGLSVARGPWSDAFPQLLERLCRIEGLERLSFTTSHPSDATEELFQVIARNPKIGRRLHLPLQSGSDRMLRRMKRLHTYAEYKAKIDRLRELVPEIAITTDIIVGFSGETGEDHKATRRALEEIRFNSAFIYKYSVRPGTPAAKLADDVPDDVKASRLQELLALQKGISEEKSRGLIGGEFTVFVEGKNPENPQEQVARMDQDRRVLFESAKDHRGQFVRVKLTGLYHETFLAEVL